MPDSAAHPSDAIDSMSAVTLQVWRTLTTGSVTTVITDR
jgi:hypothetical protein